MSEYAWMRLNQQESEYASDTKYTKILNIGKSNYDKALSMRVLLHSVLSMPEYALIEFWIQFEFWIWQRFEQARVTQGSKYATIWLNRTWICLNMSEFSIIDTVLNVYHTVHSTRSLLHKSMSTYWEIAVFRTR